MTPTELRAKAPPDATRTVKIINSLVYLKEVGGDTYIWSGGQWVYANMNNEEDDNDTTGT